MRQVVRLTGALLAGGSLLGLSAPAASAAALPLSLPPPPPAAAAGSPHLRHLQARAWVVVDAGTGQVLAAHRSEDRRRIASTTKLMTALLTLEREPLTKRFSAVPYRATAAESILGLRRGQHLTVRDLLRALLLPSANDAAATLATRVGHSMHAFVALMNRRAGQLGLAHTHYENPIGLDAAGNYSTAHDLVRLAAVLERNAFFAATVSRRSAPVHIGSRTVVVRNRNTLVGAMPWVRGVKTGHTSRAGYVLVGLGRRGSAAVFSAVLDDPSENARNADTLSLLRYGLDRLRADPTIPRGEPLARVDLRYRSGQHVDLVAGQTVSYQIAPGQSPSITLSGVPGDLNGPLTAGTAEGTALVHAGGQVVARVPLVTARPIAAASLGQRLRDYFSRGWTLGLLGGLVACSLLLVLLRRRARHHRGARME